MFSGLSKTSINGRMIGGRVFFDARDLTGSLRVMAAENPDEAETLLELARLLDMTVEAVK